MTFAANLKAHRTAAGLTQAELAEDLHLSAQAVSRWERGESYPEITLLPVLARRFRISVDALLGVKEPLTPAETQQLLENCHRLYSHERQEEAILLCRKAIEENPDNFDLKLGLAQLYATGPANGDASGNENLRNAAALLEAISKECGTPQLVLCAENLLLTIYYQLGWRDQLQKLQTSRSVLQAGLLYDPLTQSMRGNDRIAASQSAIYDHMGATLQAIDQLTDPYIPGDAISHTAEPGETEWQYDRDQLAWLLETGLLLYDRVFGEAYQGLMLHLPWKFAMKLCRQLMAQKLLAPARDALQKAVDYALRADGNQERYEAFSTYRSLLNRVGPQQPYTDAEQLRTLNRLSDQARALLLEPFSTTPALNHLNAWNYGVPYAYGGTWLCTETLRAVQEEPLLIPLQQDPACTGMLEALQSAAASAS